MAASRKASFIPSFVSGNFNFTAPKQVNKAFNTVRTAGDRVSAKVTLQAMHFDETTKSIKVFCSDGNLRECRIERLPTKAQGQKLWRDLQQAGKDKKEVHFKAAGGFSPDKWFYGITE
jgi:hypothetical protein